MDTSLWDISAILGKDSRVGSKGVEVREMRFTAEKTSSDCGNGFDWGCEIVVRDSEIFCQAPRDPENSEHAVLFFQIAQGCGYIGRNFQNRAPQSRSPSRS